MSLEQILRHHGFDRSLLSLPEYQRAGEAHLLYLLRVPATQALAQWDVLRNLVPETGYWPAIGWDLFQKPSWEEQDVQEIIEEGLRIDVQEWLKEEASRTPIDEDKERRHVDDAYDPLVFRLYLNRFPFTPPPFVPITLVPTMRCWEVPAYLPVQANDWDPSLAVSVALLKYWYERWEAEVVGIYTGILEMRVLRPPTVWEDAFELAKEQYLYCPDLVDQQTWSVNTLAKMLLNSPVWRFWWD
jgi:hypothetical protein